jgi:repressor LexA
MSVDYYVQEKLKQLRHTHNYTLEQLAHKVGTSAITLSRYETGKRAVNLTMLATICDVYGMSVASFFAANKQAPPARVIHEQTQDSPKHVQIYGEIAAGDFTSAIESMIDEIEIPQAIANRFGHDNLFGLAVKGESMNKIVQNNDYVILNRQQNANNGDIVALLLNNEDATLKRFFQLDAETIVLKPESNCPEFQPMTIDLRGAHTSLTILGKVVWYCAPYYSF